jgi:hypothetical protein
MATPQRGVENVGNVAEWYYSGILWLDSDTRRRIVIVDG